MLLPNCHALQQNELASPIHAPVCCDEKGKQGEEKRKEKIKREKE